MKTATPKYIQHDIFGTAVQTDLFLDAPEAIVSKASDRELDEAQELQQEEKPIALVVKKPQQLTGDIIEDYRLAAGEEWGRQGLFQIEDTSWFFSFYLNEKLCKSGLDIYKPIKFEGRIIAHKNCRLQPNGKRADKSGYFYIPGFKYE